MQPTPAQIIKYFKRECTPYEAELVHRYLSAHPEVLEEYVGEKEWRDLAHYSSPKSSRTEKMLGNILLGIERHSEQKVRLINPAIVNALAACLCIAVTILLWVHFNPVSKAKPVPFAAKVTKQLNWRTTINKANHELSVLLDDGSHIVMEPKAAIKYTVPFKRNAREIYLKGVARFYVAKDKSRPFTVYAGPLATTALGTVFKITAKPNSIHTKVRLLSGKVKVVQYQNPEPQSQAVYLLPGKELVFNNKHQSLIVSAFNTNPVKANFAVQAGKTIIKGDTLNFTNQQLPLVINKIEETYNVQIQSRVSLKKYYFTGEFNTRTESLNNVLGTITALNKLHFNLQPDSTYIITKK
ncbi:FecR family protein [uncultured Mucilaginibacter sp.]|uniref:FecR family protein n=1 Tax=uncultured Mucilaginibacter sp. TaxID=797541 RepID=UPI0025D1007E|nr:FecR family protein [uncultured Mucilaginibacter sp.]